MRKSDFVPKDNASKIIFALGADPLWYVTTKGIMKAHLDVLTNAIHEWGPHNVQDFTKNALNLSAASKFKRLPQEEKKLELLLHFYKPISKIIRDANVKKLGYHFRFADTRDLEKGMRIRLCNSQNQEVVADFNFDLDLSLKNDPMLILANRQIINPEENLKLKKIIEKPALDLFLGLFKEAFSKGLIFALNPMHHAYNDLYDAASMRIIADRMLGESKLTSDEHNQVQDWLEKEHGQLGTDVRKIINKLSHEDYTKLMQWVNRTNNPHSAGVRKILAKISQIEQDNRNSHFASLNRNGFDTSKNAKKLKYFFRK